MQAATDRSPTQRPWLWAQLLIGWLPAWALFTLLMHAVHEMPLAPAAANAARLVLLAAVLGLAVMRVAARRPWPHPWRWRFLALHLLAAPAFAVAWWVLNSAVESAWRGRWVVIRGPGFTAFFVTGVWLYVMVAGITYAQQAARAAAQAQALQARARLAALRAQLHPHFLFNALHTVVQLIALDPKAATRATEQLAALLRQTLDAEGDLVTLREEWTLVQRYLALEQLRLGDRLEVQPALDEEALDATLPSFALQTLVENAVRHGAEPQVRATRLQIEARREGRDLLVQVRDDGVGLALPEGTWPAQGSGLRRLRERLAALHGDAASLTVASEPGRGFTATLRVPQEEAGHERTHD